MARPVLSRVQLDTERKRLSEVALMLFREYGYEAVTLRRIAAAAGVSKGQPYSYFASKEDLFAYLRAELVNQFSSFIITPSVGVKDPLARIRAILLRFVDFVIAHPEEYRLMFSLHQPDPRKYPELMKSRLGLMKPMFVAFQQAIDANLLQGEAGAHAHIAWAMVHGLLSLHAANQLVQGYELKSLVIPAIEQLFEAHPALSRKSRANVPAPRRAVPSSKK